MTAASTASVPLTTEPLWYQEAVLYEAHVRAFADSDGDGVGDFRGLLGKLDYLQELGITALWLLPFYPSPLRDDGYDISDYRNVHESYGTLRDFRAVLRGAHARGMRVITELVLAHTSDEHPWFKRARLAPKGSTYRDFYTWSDAPDRYRDARVIFSDFETTNWAFDPVADAYYWHRFYSHQPSLNYDSPAVRKAMFDVVDFWLEMGVDGLRLDAVPYLYAREGTTCENLPDTFGFLRDLRSHIDRRFDGRMLLAEANQWPEDAVAYLGDGGTCHMAFHFPLMPRMFMAARQEDRFPIVDILNETPPIPPNRQWGLFLRNHDELTLEMVTDEERDYMYRVYAEDPRARINVGIRRRLAPLLGNDRKLIEMMNGLLFSLPGTPIIYYGDEIGMGDNIYLGDRNAVRTPMQWDSDRNAGFSKANPQRLYLPIIIDPEYHAQAVNVGAQEQNANSMLWWMRRLVALRNRYRAFAVGSLELLFPDNRKVLAFLRRHDDEIILVVVNLSRFTQAVEIDLAEFRGLTPVELFGSTEFPPIGDLPYFVTLGSHGFYWFSLEQRGPAATAGPPSLVVRGPWTDVFRGAGRSPLNRALVQQLATRRWFRDKSRRIRATEVVDHLPVPGGAGMPPAGYLVIVRVLLDTGLPETYVLPLAHATDDAAAEVRKWRGESILSELSSADGDGVVYDALAEPAFARALVDLMAGRRQLSGRSLKVASVPARALRRLRAGLDPDAAVTAITTEQSNTSVVIGNRVILKLIRRVEEGHNPDVEIGRFLTEQAGFSHSPAVGGALELRDGAGDEPATIAVLQEFVVNEGDGWNYVLDALGRVLEEAIARPDPTDLDLDLPVRLLDVADQVPAHGHFLVGPQLQWAEVLGRRTAEMHLALAANRDDAAFAPAPLTAVDRRSLHHGARSLLRQSLRAVQSIREPGECVRQLLRQERSIFDRLQVVTSLPITAMKIRVHGDYHLGQVLWTGKDFVIIDFEGEPARTLSSRRLKRSALVDVAGMIRSFHYASKAAGNRLSRDLLPSREPAALDPLLTLWYRAVAGAFLRSYLAHADGAPFLPADHAELAALLDFLLFEKAIYELGYEANNRPDWADIPAQGLLDLLEAGR